MLDVLKELNLEESTIVTFISDHGFSIGERGQWGKRSLFESDARVPWIVVDPRHSSKHGTHTPAIAELVDVFPTLADLAGLPMAPKDGPDSIAEQVPRLSGVSQAALVRGGHQAKHVKHFALTQFARCPVVAEKKRDYRSVPSTGAIHWECGWKGWEWHKHHDLALMGYSIRVKKWRYTVWVPWDSEAVNGLWTYPPFGNSQIMSHGPTDPPTHGSTDPRTHGPTDPRTHGPTDPLPHYLTTSLPH